MQKEREARARRKRAPMAQLRRGMTSRSRKQLSHGDRESKDHPLQATLEFLWDPRPKEVTILQQGHFGQMLKKLQPGPQGGKLPSADSDVRTCLITIAVDVE